MDAKDLIGKTLHLEGERYNVVGLEPPAVEDMTPMQRAGHEWDTTPAARAGWIDRKTYVAYRANQLTKGGAL